MRALHQYAAHKATRQRDINLAGVVGGDVAFEAHARVGLGTVENIKKDSCSGRFFAVICQKSLKISLPLIVLVRISALAAKDLTGRVNCGVIFEGRRQL